MDGIVSCYCCGNLVGYDERIACDVTDYYDLCFPCFEACRVVFHKKMLEIMQEADLKRRQGAAGVD